MIKKYFLLQTYYINCINIYKLILNLSICVTLIFIFFLINTFLYVNSGQLNKNIINQIKKYGLQYGLNIEIDKIYLLEDLQTIKLENITITDIYNKHFNTTIKILKLKPQILTNTTSLFTYTISFQQCELDQLSLDIKTLDINKLNNINITSYINIDLNNIAFKVINSNITINEQLNNSKYYINNLNLEGELVKLNEQLNIKLHALNSIIQSNLTNVELVNSKLNISIDKNYINIEDSLIKTNIGTVNIGGQIETSNFNSRLNINTNINLASISNLANNQKINGQLLFIGLLNKTNNEYIINGKLNINKLNIKNYNIDSINIKNFQLAHTTTTNIQIDNLETNLLEFNKQTIKSVFIDKLSINNLLNTKIEGSFNNLVTNLNTSKLKSNGTFNINNNKLYISGIVNNLNFASLLPKPNLLSASGNTSWTFQATSNLANKNGFIVDLKIKNKGLVINDLATNKIEITTRINSLRNIKVNLAAKILDNWQYLKATLEVNKANRPIFIESNITSLEVETTIKKYFPVLANMVKGVVSGQLKLAGPTLNARGLTTFEHLQGKLNLTEVSLKIAGQKLNIATPLDIPLNGSIKLEPSLLLSQKSFFSSF